MSLPPFFDLRGVIQLLKKVFSVVLAIVLVFSSFPCYAFAEDIDVSEPMAEASQTESGNTDATEGEDTDATEAEETSSDAEDKVGEEFDEESEKPAEQSGGEGAADADAQVPVVEDAEDSGSVALERITLSNEKLEVKMGESAALTVELYPEDASGQEVVWETSNAAIVTVDDNGGITPVSVGTATIRASAKEDPGISDTCEVTVWDSCGDNVRWYVLEDGATMVIDGTGPIADSANPMKQPWKNVRAKITEIKLGSDITAIGNLSFAGFNKLASLDIPEGSKLESIGKNAFMGTSKLTEIYLPGTLKRIDDTNIGNKEKIHYRGTAADWEKLNYKAAKATVYVLDEAGNEVEYVADPYKCGADARYSFDSDGGVLTITGTGATEDYTSVANTPWYELCSQIKAVVVQSGITSVGGYAFAECENLEKVTLADTVTSIGTYAFRTDTKLTEINLENVQLLGNSCFTGCVGLSQANLYSARSIGEQAFTNCTGLTEVSLGSAETCVAEIGKRAFNGCTSLKTVAFTNVKKIVDYAFEKAALESADLSSVESIGANAFAFTKNLKTVVFGSSLTTIGSAAFSMSGLTTVDIPGGVSSIGGSAFSGCNSMVSMTLNEGISVIPNGMVQSGTALETVSLPQSLTKVEQYAFYECGALKTVKYAGTQDQWGKVTVEEYNDPLVAIMGEKTIAVTGVTLGREALELQLGGAEETLHAAVTPENATNRNVIWKSDNENVVTVGADGKLSAVSAGSATITVSTEDGGFTAACKVTVSKVADDLDISGFRFTVNNPMFTDPLLTENTLTLQKQEDNSYLLIAPTYAIDQTALNGITLRIEAPSEIEAPFSVKYTAWKNDAAATYLGERTVTSENGAATIDCYYQNGGEVSPDIGWKNVPVYSDFLIQIEGQKQVHRVSLVLYNELRKITISNKSNSDAAAPVITKLDAQNYEVTLTRGETYKMEITAGLQLTTYKQGVAYISERGSTEEKAGTIEYTPSEESEKYFTIRAASSESSYGIEERSYSLHVIVEAPPQNPLRFQKYEYTINGETTTLEAGAKYIIPKITQYDDFSIKAVVENADDTAVFHWTRGLGLNNTPIDDQTGSSVKIDTTSIRIMDYAFNCTVECGGQTIALPMLRAQSVKALVLVQPEIAVQPKGGEYPAGAEINLTTEIKQLATGTVRCQWYRCSGEDYADATPIEGANSCTVGGAGWIIPYTVPSQETGSAWYFCEIYAYKKEQDLSSDKVRTDCVQITIVEPDLPMKGKGTSEDPYLIASQEDLIAIQKAVAEGNAFVEKYFTFADNITLPTGWEPIGCTKDGTNDIQAGANLNAFSGNINGAGFTLTVPVGGKPLLGYVRGATIKDLKIYGERIDGYGLVNNFEGVGLSGSAIIIDNVTLKSGSKTLKSGLIGANITTNGYAGCSAGFTATIRNCTIERNVIIGYTGTENRIGSIAGRLQGTVENCVSYATVRGNQYVGGLVGVKDNAMGYCEVTNSQFHGTVEGNSYVGGISGGPYSGEAAPNGIRLSITGCTVDGTVKGKSCVGGILGGDPKVAQAWNDYSITGNVFSGTATGEKYVGGIIGYYESLNKCDTIANNVYTIGGDVKTGIGFVHYLDTSYPNPTTMEGTIAFNTGETTDNCPETAYCSWRKDFNRTDDPLGKDAEKLTKASNGSDSSVCYKLVASGDYKKEYYVGDALDLSGIQLTAYWTSGKTTDVALKDVTISGYNKDEAGTQYVRLTYKEVNCLITVTVIPRSSKITVSVSIYGDSKHGASGGVHGLAMGGLSLWASEPNMEADTTETVWDVLKRVFSKHSMSVDASDNNQYNTIYISSINGLGEFDNGKLSGWMYTVNGSHPDVGVSARYLKQGDEIILHYTDDYTKEEGGMTPVEKPGTAKDVIDLIDKIGTVSFTDACKAKIDAARKAYDALSTEEKAKVTNYKKLTDAEDQYKKLKEADDKAKAKAVDNLISKIGTVTINSGAAINAAWNGYYKLTAEQKELVTKLSTLQEATRKWNQLKADEVIKLIDKIEDPVTEKSSASIGAARKAYDALTKDQKNLVTNVKKLTDAETAYAKLTASEEDKKKAQEVIDLIDKLKDVTPDSEKDIEAARKAYDALTDLQKKLVDNYDILTTAETKLAMLKAMGKVSNPYITTGDYMEALGTPSVGSIGGEWMVIGLARSDRNVPGVEDYYKKVQEYVAENIDPETGRLHKAKSTDNSRIIIALTAIGKDVTNVGGYNLLAGLSDLEFVKYQGNNGPIWALLALDSGNYPVPSGGTVTRRALIDEILRVQTSDGGWTVSGDKADSDMTGMALTALAPYYTKDLKVQEAIDKAIARLSEMQDEDGGYSTSYDGTTKIATSESISQVVTALSALGINADTDPRFVKNGNSVIDALLRYYVKGGGFKHIMDSELDGMATEQAYYALTAYYRFLDGKTNLYDMTDVIDMGGDVVTVEPTVPATTEPAQANTPWWIIAVCIFGGVGWGIVIGVVLVPKLKKKD